MVRKKRLATFPPRESLVSDIPAGDGNVAKLFLQYKYDFVVSSTKSECTISSYNQTNAETCETIAEE
jgi:hypothetical protein